MLVLILRLALCGGSAQGAAPVLDWQTRGVGGGGALFSPSFSPYDAKELWISCDMSELFQTTTLGSAWRMVPFRRLQGNRESCVRFTADPKVLYTLDYTGDVRHPARSADGGKTWATLAMDPTGADAYGLWADPVNAGGTVATQRLILSSYDTVFFSSNGGTSWNSVYVNANGGNGVRVAGVYWDASTIVVATNVGVLASANGGTSFAISALTGIPAGQTIVSFAGAKAGNVTRFLCSTVTGATYGGQMVEDFYGMVATGPMIFTLDWGTSTAWVKHATGLPIAHRLTWVGMAANDVQTLWVAGDDGTEVPVMWRSTNAGTSWSSRLTTANNGNVATGWAGQGGDRGWTYGGSPVGFSVAPNDAAKAAFTDYGFCHLTTDGGATWRQAYVKPADQNPAGSPTPTGRAYHSVGLENTTCWQVLFPTPGRVLLGNSDIKASKSDDGGYTWGFNYTGHSDNSMYRVAKHANGKLYAATSTIHDMYESTYLQDVRIENNPGGKVLVSADNGANWTVVKNFGKPVIWVATDPTNAERLYAAVIHWANGVNPQGGIYRTDNLSAGASSVWTKCTSPTRTEGHPYNLVVLADGTVVATYSGRRNNSGTFTASSGVFVSTDQGVTWIDRSHANMQYWTKDLVVDPNDATQNTWYACVFNGWGGAPNNKGGVYRTTNRGVAWTQLFSNATVPSTLANVESITVHPTSASVAYVTTEQDGLWYTGNLGAASPTWEQVATYPFRQPTRVFFDPNDNGKLWVTSFGHGLCVGNAPLASWREEQFGPQSTNALVSGDAADPDGDGVNNLLEFGQHTNPLAVDALPLGPAALGATAGLPMLTSPGTWKFEFLRRSSATAPGVTYIAEYSTDLTTGWLPLTGNPQVTTLDDTWERLSWPVNNASPRVFCRLRVTRP